MANFGADIVMQNAANRGSFFDRMFNIAQSMEQSRQFEKQLKIPKDKSMAERDLDAIMRWKAGDQSVRPYLEGRAAMEGAKTQYSPDPFNPGTLRAMTMPNSFEMLLGGSGISSAPDMTGQYRTPPFSGDAPGTFDKLLDSTLSGNMPPSPGIPQMDNQQYIAAILSGQIQSPESPDAILQQYPIDPASLVTESPRSIPTLGDTGRYQGSQKQQLDRGAAQTQVEQAGSMLPIDAAKADIEASKSGASSYASQAGKNQADFEAKIIPINNIIAELEDLGENTIKKLPSGFLESTGASLSNLAGYPTDQALAQSDIDVKLPYIQGQIKQIVRTAGEGTFTDADQAIVNKMVFKDTDSVAVKVKKYNQLLDLMKRGRDRITGTTETFAKKKESEPGWGYIGVKK